MKYSLQCLFWIVTLVAVLCGWWYDRTHYGHWHRAYLDQLQLTKEQVKAHEDQVSDTKAWQLESKRWMKRWQDCLDGDTTKKEVMP